MSIPKINSSSHISYNSSRNPINSSKKEINIKQLNLIFERLGVSLRIVESVDGVIEFEDNGLILGEFSLIRFNEYLADFKSSSTASVDEGILQIEI